MIIKIFFIICLFIVPQHALCGGSLLGEWHAETESEYKLRLTVQDGGAAILEYRDIDVDGTGKSTCKPIEIKWRKKDNRLILEGLPCIQTYEFSLKGDTFVPIYKESKCNNYYLFHSDFFRSTVTDYRKKYVELWDLFDCRN